jgi:hypothetical protein
MNLEQGMDISARKTMRVTDSVLDIEDKPQSAFANPEATAKLHVGIETIWSELEKLDRILQHRMALKQGLVTWKEEGATYMNKLIVSSLGSGWICTNSVQTPCMEHVSLV